MYSVLLKYLKAVASDRFVLSFTVCKLIVQTAIFLNSVLFEDRIFIYISYNYICSVIQSACMYTEA